MVNLSTIASIHQPMYMPWIGYFHKLNFSDIYVVFDDCQAIKQSHMNRVRIQNNGKEYWLTVPIKFKFSSLNKVKEIRIDNSKKWSEKHFKSLITSYSKTSFFHELLPVLEKIYSKRYEFLIDLNLDFLFYVIELMNININIVKSSEINYGEHYSTQRLIEICKTLNAQYYLCGMGSKGYLDEKRFFFNNIGLIYQNFKMPKYIQRDSGKFISGLSILDTYSNIGRERVLHILKQNTLYYGEKSDQIC